MSHPARLLVSCLFLLSFATQATQRGITEKGDEVLLEDDGTWHYLKAPPEGAASSPVSVNASRFTRAKEASFTVRSSRNNAVVYINPKKWTFSKSAKNGASEYTFQSTDGDLYGMLITERISMPLDILGAAALNNMRKVAPDAELLKQEYRYVNDRKMLYMRVGATMQGMKLVYAGYYYSDEGGTTQLVAYTSQNLAQQRTAAAEEFLGGLLPMPVQAAADPKP